jgi:hypothetical protein
MVEDDGTWGREIPNDQLRYVPSIFAASDVWVPARYTWLKTVKIMV